LQPTRFLQSDDPHVVAHARTAANGRIDHGVLSETMERYVNRKLSKKHFSTAMASAAEVAETLSGDCTEHAVLLAAMLRARQIPSRVAVGLVYVDGPNAFGGHMWTEAWMDGQWIPLDATLGRGGIGAAHLKMADSNFADDAPAPFATFLPLIDALGTMKIEVLSAE
jgi:transglutaminase-like putative cysteine protease